jgi:hypothetical protein
MKLAYDKTDDKRDCFTCLWQVRNDGEARVFFCLKYYHLTTHISR